ncbi:MAG: DUF4359 domain-containing protein [Bacteroidota bacterium]
MRFLLPILIGTLLVILWWTNPEDEQFTSFLVDEVVTIVGDLGEDAGRATGGALGFLTERLGRAAGEAAGTVAGRAASQEFERSNYGIASTYTLDLNGRASGGEWTFLGVAGQFVPIKEPENLETLVRGILSGR